MNALPLAGWFAGGIVAGLAHFRLLRWNARLFITGGTLWALGVQALRLAALAGVLLFAAWHGAPPLLSTALGVITARFIATSSPRTPPARRGAAAAGR